MVSTADQLPEVGRGTERAGLDRRPHVGRRYVAEVRFAARYGGCPLLIDIETQSFQPRSSKRDDERQPGVAEADDACACTFRAQAIQQRANHGVRVCRIPAQQQPYCTSRWSEAAEDRHQSASREPVDDD